MAANAFTEFFYGGVSLRYGALAHIPTMSYTLLTLPYTVLPRVVISVNSLQTPVSTGLRYWQPVASIYSKSTGSLYSVHHFVIVHSETYLSIKFSSTNINCHIEG